MWPLFLASLLVGLVLFMRWSWRVGPEHTAYVLRWSAVAGIVGLLLALITRGGTVLALPLLSILLVLLRRWHALWRRPSPSGGPTRSSERAGSTVQTQFFRMSLDHATGEMQGVVLAGMFIGREFTDLNFEQLLELWDECQVDAQSAALLESYLNRVYSENWRERVRQDRSRYKGFTMDRDEAYEVLGLRQGATDVDIKEAHRRLMQRVHPDRGGSDYLAARINQAKGVLLGE